ncbi:hypothetical protein KCP77_08735 [Salmonella enterica subsp. enterica]|nr:hypothetical protein KCP77_08735 [Salmonella enterica subsp. enterica]
MPASHRTAARPRSDRRGYRPQYSRRRRAANPRRGGCVIRGVKFARRAAMLDLNKP